MTYCLTNIANNFIRLSGHQITPQKLVKLTYLAHGHYLAATRKPLFLELVEAWKYGPIIPELYEKVKKKDTVANYLPLDYDENPDEPIDRWFLERIYNRYRDYDGIQLSITCSAEGTLWYTLWNSYLDSPNLRQGVIMPNKLIMYEFKNL